jgi:hypothetical protein
MVPEPPPLAEGKELFTVDFEEGRTLRYKFVSSRKINLDWGFKEEKSRRRGGRNDESSGAAQSSESMDLVMAYTPTKVDPYGLTTIRAACESVNVRRTPRQSSQLRDSKDAVKSLAGKTFTFTVRPDGKIEDYSQLDQLIKEIGEKAFRANSSAGRVKEPDMISDFVAAQWFLWDSVSSIEKPIEGVSVGQSWKSVLSVPAPMIMRKARDVTYSLAEVRRTDKGRIAVIRSSYAHAESVPGSWPVPYTGSFQASGPFGLLGRFQIEKLTGQGEDLFNLDAGRAEQYKQNYHLEIAAAMMWALPGVNPHITIDQTLTMQLLEN